MNINMMNVNTGKIIDLVEYFENMVETFKESFSEENRTAVNFENYVNEDTDFILVDDDGEELEECPDKYYETFTWAATQI